MLGNNSVRTFSFFFMYESFAAIGKCVVEKNIIQRKKKTCRSIMELTVLKYNHQVSLGGQFYEL